MNKFCLHCIYESLPHEVVYEPAKTILFHETDPLTHVYRIQDGLVKINRIHASGDEKVFDILGPGDYIALLAVLQKHKEYIASAEVLTDATLIKMRYDDVLEAYETNPMFKDRCMQCALTRSNNFQNQLFQTTNIDTEEKIVAVLELMAAKFGKRKDGTMIVTLPFNKTVLANIIGIRRETLSRKLKEMHDQNIIEFEKNTYILHRM